MESAGDLVPLGAGNLPTEGFDPNGPWMKNSVLRRHPECRSRQRALSVAVAGSFRDLERRLARHLIASRHRQASATIVGEALVSDARVFTPFALPLVQRRG